MQSPLKSLPSMSAEELKFVKIQLKWADSEQHLQRVQKFQVGLEIIYPEVLDATDPRVLILVGNGGLQQLPRLNRIRHQ